MLRESRHLAISKWFIIIISLFIMASIWFIYNFEISKKQFITINALGSNKYSSYFSEIQINNLKKGEVKYNNKKVKLTISKISKDKYILNNNEVYYVEFMIDRLNILNTSFLVEYVHPSVKINEVIKDFIIKELNI